MSVVRECPTIDPYFEIAVVAYYRPKFGVPTPVGHRGSLLEHIIHIAYKESTRCGTWDMSKDPSRTYNVLV